MDFNFSKKYGTYTSWEPEDEMLLNNMVASSDQTTKN
jgi:hypothetical protein